MARPLSEEKRKAILAAATKVIAEEGPGAPTAKISKAAGVAEGSLFTYFATKDDLLNHLYLTLKAELKDAMMSSFPKAGSLKKKARHVWDRYVDWGVLHPHKQKAMSQLGVCDRITEQCKAAANDFQDLSVMIEESIKSGILRDHPPEFVAAIMGSLAETTMQFVSRNPRQAELYRATGFDAFWNAIART